RLFRLIKHGFDGAIPSETVVSRLFGITERRAITVISIVSNRHRSDFERGWIAAAQVAFDHREAVQGTAGTYQFTAPRVVISYLDEITSTLRDGRLPRVQPAKGTAGRYEIKQDTLDALCAALRITPAPLL
ncbi:MAG TPA: hypothetical protein VHT92_05240, partial [Candidatus Cybelea sp.]|nr:hypothetical protein [Candidatus Cybelea sp.]